MLLLLLLLLLKYYPEEKNFENVHCDLKEEPDLKSSCCFTLLEPLMPGSESQCRQICLDMCNFVNMPEYA